MYLYNARIHTLDPQRPSATALAIQNDRIVAIGDEAEIWAEFHLDEAGSEGSQDMAGQVILPGLTDAHIHLEMYALSLQRVDCETETLQECLKRVAERARQTPPGEWILGHGWNQNNWAEGFGSAADLDAAAPHNPVYLTAKSYHAGWASGLALNQAEISAATPDPLNGRLGRDAHGALGWHPVRERHGAGGKSRARAQPGAGAGCHPPCAASPLAHGRHRRARFRRAQLFHGAAKPARARRA